MAGEETGGSDFLIAIQLKNQADLLLLNETLKEIQLTAAKGARFTLGIDPSALTNALVDDTTIKKTRGRKRQADAESAPVLPRPPQALKEPGLATGSLALLVSKVDEAVRPLQAISNSINNFVSRLDLAAARMEQAAKRVEAAMHGEPPPDGLPPGRGVPPRTAKERKEAERSREAERGIPYRAPGTAEQEARRHAQIERQEESRQPFVNQLASAIKRLNDEMLDKLLPLIRTSPAADFAPGGTLHGLAPQGYRDALAAITNRVQYDPAQRRRVDELFERLRAANREREQAPRGTIASRARKAGDVTAADDVQKELRELRQTEREAKAAASDLAANGPSAALDAANARAREARARIQEIDERTREQSSARYLLRTELAQTGVVAVTPRSNVGLGEDVLARARAEGQRRLDEQVKALQARELTFSGHTGSLADIQSDEQKAHEEEARKRELSTTRSQTQAAREAAENFRQIENTKVTYQGEKLGVQTAGFVPLERSVVQEASNEIKSMLGSLNDLRSYLKRGGAPEEVRQRGVVTFKNLESGAVVFEQPRNVPNQPAELGDRGEVLPAFYERVRREKPDVLPVDVVDPKFANIEARASQAVIRRLGSQGVKALPRSEFQAQVEQERTRIFNAEQARVIRAETKRAGDLYEQRIRAELPEGATAAQQRQFAQLERRREALNPDIVSVESQITKIVGPAGAEPTDRASKKLLADLRAKLAELQEQKRVITQDLASRRRPLTRQDQANIAQLREQFEEARAAIDDAINIKEGGQAPYTREFERYRRQAITENQATTTYGKIVSAARAAKLPDEGTTARGQGIVTPGSVATLLRTRDRALQNPLVSGILGAAGFQPYLEAQRTFDEADQNVLEVGKRLTEARVALAQSKGSGSQRRKSTAKKAVEVLEQEAALAATKLDEARVALQLAATGNFGDESTVQEFIDRLKLALTQINPALAEVKSVSGKRTRRPKPEDVKSLIAQAIDPGQPAAREAATGKLLKYEAQGLRFAPYSSEQIDQLSELLQEKVLARNALQGKGGRDAESDRTRLDKQIKQIEDRLIIEPGTGRVSGGEIYYVEPGGKDKFPGFQSLGDPELIAKRASVLEEAAGIRPADLTPKQLATVNRQHAELDRQIEAQKQRAKVARDRARELKRALSPYSVDLDTDPDAPARERERYAKAKAAHQEALDEAKDADRQARELQAKADLLPADAVTEPRRQALLTKSEELRKAGDPLGLADLEVRRKATEEHLAALGVAYPRSEADLGQALAVLGPQGNRVLGEVGLRAILQRRYFGGAEAASNIGGGQPPIAPPRPVAAAGAEGEPVPPRQPASLPASIQALVDNLPDIKKIPLPFQQVQVINAETDAIQKQAKATQELNEAKEASRRLTNKQAQEGRVTTGEELTAIRVRGQIVLANEKAALRPARPALVDRTAQDLDERYRQAQLFPAASEFTAAEFTRRLKGASEATVRNQQSQLKAQAEYESAASEEQRRTALGRVANSGLAFSGSARQFRGIVGAAIENPEFQARFERVDRGLPNEPTTRETLANFTAAIETNQQTLAKIEQLTTVERVLKEAEAKLAESEQRAAQLRNLENRSDLEQAQLEKREAERDAAQTQVTAARTRQTETIAQLGFAPGTETATAGGVLREQLGSQSARVAALAATLRGRVGGALADAANEVRSTKETNAAQIGYFADLEKQQARSEERTSRAQASYVASVDKIGARIARSSEKLDRRGPIAGPGVPDYDVRRARLYVNLPPAERISPNEEPELAGIREIIETRKRLGDTREEQHATNESAVAQAIANGAVVGDELRRRHVNVSRIIDDVYLGGGAGGGAGGSGGGGGAGGGGDFGERAEQISSLAGAPTPELLRQLDQVQKAIIREQDNQRRLRAVYERAGTPQDRTSTLRALAQSGLNFSGRELQYADVLGAAVQNPYVQRKFNLVDKEHFPGEATTPQLIATYSKAIDASQETLRQIERLTAVEQELRIAEERLAEREAHVAEKRGAEIITNEHQAQLEDLEAKRDEAARTVQTITARRSQIIGQAGFAPDSEAVAVEGALNEQLVRQTGAVEGSLVALQKRTQGVLQSVTADEKQNKQLSLVEETISRTKRLFEYATGGFFIYSLFFGIRSLVTQVVGLQSELAKVQGLVPGRNFSDALKIQDSAIQSAKTYGQSIQDVLQLQEKLLPGHTPAQAISLTNDILLGQRGAGLSQEQATNLALGIEEQTGGKTSAADIFDRIARISTTHPISGDDLALAIQRLGPLAGELQPNRVGGIDRYDVIIGLVTQIHDETRVTGEAAAASARFILSRLNNATVQQKLQQQFGIGLAANAEGTELRPLTDILGDISRLYQQLKASGNTGGAAALLATVAGSRQSATGEVILGSFDKILDTAAESSKAYGDAQARLALQADTVSFKLTQLGNSALELVTNIVQGTGVLSAFSGTIGLLNNLAKGISGGDRGTQSAISLGGGLALSLAGLAGTAGAAKLATRLRAGRQGVALAGEAPVSLYASAAEQGAAAEGVGFFARNLGDLFALFSKAAPLLEFAAIVSAIGIVFSLFNHFVDEYKGLKDRYSPGKFDINTFVETERGKELAQQATRFGVTPNDLVQISSGAAGAARDAAELVIPKLRGNYDVTEESQRSYLPGARDALQSSFITALKTRLPGFSALSDEQQQSEALELLRNTGAAESAQTNFVSEDVFRKLTGERDDILGGIAKITPSQGLLVPGPAGAVPLDLKTAPHDVVLENIAQQFHNAFDNTTVFGTYHRLGEDLGGLELKQLDPNAHGIKLSEALFKELQATEHATDTQYGLANALDDVTKKYFGISESQQRLADSLEAGIHKTFAAEPTERQPADITAATYRLQAAEFQKRLAAGDKTVTPEAIQALTNRARLAEQVYGAFQENFQLAEQGKSLALGQTISGTGQPAGAEYGNVLQDVINKVINDEVAKLRATPGARADQIEKLQAALSSPAYSKAFQALIANQDHFRPANDYILSTLGRYEQQRSEIEGAQAAFAPIGVGYDAIAARAQASQELVRGLSGTQAHLENQLLQAGNKLGLLDLIQQGNVQGIPNLPGTGDEETTVLARDYIGKLASRLDDTNSAQRGELNNQITVIQQELKAVRNNDTLFKRLPGSVQDEVTQGILTSKLGTLYKSFDDLRRVVEQLAFQDEQEVQARAERIRQLQQQSAAEQSSLRATQAGGALRRQFGIREAGINGDIGTELALRQQDIAAQFTDRVAEARLALDQAIRGIQRGAAGEGRPLTQAENQRIRDEQGKYIQAQRDAAYKAQIDQATLLQDQQLTLEQQRQQTADRLTEESERGLTDVLAGGYLSFRGPNRRNRQGVRGDQVFNRILEPFFGTIQGRSAQTFTGALFGPDGVFGGALGKFFGSNPFQDTKQLQAEAALKGAIESGTEKGTKAGVLAALAEADAGLNAAGTADTHRSFADAVAPGTPLGKVADFVGSHAASPLVRAAATLLPVATVAATAAARKSGVIPAAGGLSFAPGVHLEGQQQYVDAIDTALKAAGDTALVESGTRTPAEQQELRIEYARAQAANKRNAKGELVDPQTGHVFAGPPSQHSLHEEGRALDIVPLNTTYEELDRRLAAVGYVRPEPTTDRVHYSYRPDLATQLVGAGSAAVTSATQGIFTKTLTDAQADQIIAAHHAVSLSLRGRAGSQIRTVGSGLTLQPSLDLTGLTSSSETTPFVPYVPSGPLAAVNGPQVFTQVTGALSDQEAAQEAQAEQARADYARKQAALGAVGDQLGTILGGALGTQTGVRHGLNYGPEGASLLSSVGTSLGPKIFGGLGLLAGPVGGVVGGLLGGLLGGIFGKPNVPVQQPFEGLQRIERNTRETVTAINNQTRNLYNLDNRFLNVPATFSVPAYLPFAGGGGGGGNHTFNIGVGDIHVAGGDSGAVAANLASNLADALEAELRGRGTFASPLPNR